jgi:starch phosphorylase
MDVDKVKDLCIFTTHTPVDVGHDKFYYNLVQEVLCGTVPIDAMKRFGGQDRLNMTLLALNLSKYVNGVAKRHREYSMELFPGRNISSITNGVHSFTWTCESFRNLFDRYMPGWAEEPALLVRINAVPDEKIWEAHMEAKDRLLDFVSKKKNINLDRNALTLGFARRMAAYKRPTLLFSDLKRIEQIGRETKLQVIFAGKAHPQDLEGKRLIEETHGFIEKMKDAVKIVYLEDYDMEMAAKLTSGVDVWLNTPLPPYEASGTSGMKAAHNGVVNFGSLDGWWIEGCIEGVTGWSIGPRPDESGSAEERKNRELADLYGKLSNTIAPMFYNRRNEWVELMKSSIGKIAYYFNSHRMMHRYTTEAYM